MNKAYDTICKRVSIRGYDGRPVEPATLDKISLTLRILNTGPFGNAVRLAIIDTTGEDPKMASKLGTYGSIKGTRMFIAGVVKKGPGANEDFGYCLEKAVLEATELGLATVWLGASLNRGNFEHRLNASSDEMAPAVTPIGYARSSLVLNDRIIRTVIGSRKRKPHHELFFYESFSKPLDMGTAGPYAQVLEAVRLAPSAGNKQPWRIIRDNKNGAWHLYLNESKLYNSLYGEIKMQDLDMGIAICHFEVVARELSLNGSWKIALPEIEAKKLRYVISWVE